MGRADRAVPARAHRREVHRLQQVDASLDTDQWMSTLDRHPKARLGLLLGPPLLWLGVAYLGALAALFVTALWTANGFTGDIERTWTLDNFHDVWSLEVYRTITIRTLLTAVGVTVTDAAIAFP